MVIGSVAQEPERHVVRSAPPPPEPVRAAPPAPQVQEVHEEVPQVVTATVIEEVAPAPQPQVTVTQEELTMLTPARSHNQSQNNIAVLEKERQLGQELLERAANGISEDVLKKVAEVDDEKHLHAIRTFLAMLQLAAEGECTTNISKEEI